jgi:hypothetical protein
MSGFEAQARNLPGSFNWFLASSRRSGSDPLAPNSAIQYSIHLQSSSGALLDPERRLAAFSGSRHSML